VLGWTDVVKANPQILLDRGYDKVIAVRRRSLREQIKAEALYHRDIADINDLIDLQINEPTFVKNVIKKYTIFDEQISKINDDPRFLNIFIEDWNNRTVIIYNQILDFLGFPKENRPLIVPVKVDRDFEAYSDSHEKIEHVPCDNIARIRHYDAHRIDGHRHKHKRRAHP